MEWFAGLFEFGSAASDATMRSNRKRHFLPIWFLALLLGVAGASPVVAAELQFPPLVDPASQEHHIGKVILLELVTPDLAATKQFYAGLFGWTYRDIEAGATQYAEASLDGRPVAGLLYTASAGRSDIDSRRG